MDEAQVRRCPVVVGAAMGFSLVLPGFQGHAVEVVGVDSHGAWAQPVDPDSHTAAHGQQIVRLYACDLLTRSQCVNPCGMIHRPLSFLFCCIDTNLYARPLR